MIVMRGQLLLECILKVWASTQIMRNHVSSASWPLMTPYLLWSLIRMQVELLRAICTLGLGLLTSRPIVHSQCLSKTLLQDSCCT